jgi:hypothetical protein
MKEHLADLAQAHAQLWPILAVLKPAVLADAIVLIV